MQDDFAVRLNTLYREIDHHGARRVADARERPSSETLAELHQALAAGATASHHPLDEDPR